MNLSESLLNPGSVALVGASSDPTKNSARPQRLLRKYGYQGRILPINPGRSEIMGERAYARLSEAPGPIDHAFIMVGSDRVESVLEECAERGVPVATIFSDGFAETGESGRIQQEHLVQRAKTLGVRLLGPNCIGLVNFSNGVALTVNSILEMDLMARGDLSVVSQSGSMLGALLSRGTARGLGFAKMVSVGNECDIGVGEIVDMLVDDPETRVILLFLETVRDAKTLERAALRAHAEGKPIVVYKLGRSALGEELAKSHTGAIAGNDAAAEAWFHRLGMIRVNFLDSLIEIAPLLRGRRPAPTSADGRRVGVITTTGGGAATVVDRLGLVGVDTMVPSAKFIATMAVKGILIRPTPIIDLTMTATGDAFNAVVEALLEDEACDAVLAVVGSSAQTRPQIAVDRLLDFAGRSKPVVAFLAPQADAAGVALSQAGIPVFRTPESCAEAIAAYLRWTTPVHEPRAGVTPWPADLPTQGALNEVQALALFRSLGIETVPCSVACEPEFQHSTPYPVVAKVLSADVTHKTEVGGVALGVEDAEELRRQATNILASVRAENPSARIDGLLVQPMVKGLAEVILGYRHDPSVGPIVMVGIGGRLAEIYQDTSLGCAPVGLQEAHRMIEEVKGLAIVRGYRRMPRGDVDALAQAIVAMSRLALLEGQPVLEAEINPLMVQTSGVVAVDGVVILKETK